MPGSIAKRAVVIGAGMGGLAAAKAIAPDFEEVTVIARPRRAAGGAGSARGNAAGAPRACAARGRPTGSGRAVSRIWRRTFEAPAQSRRGRAATSIQERSGFDPFPRRDLGFDVLLSFAAPLLETVCRRCLRQEPNIEIRPRSRVAEARAGRRSSRGRRGSLRNRQSGKEETLAVDLVVDASGRAAPTLALLEFSARRSRRKPRSAVDLGLRFGRVRDSRRRSPATGRGSRITRRFLRRGPRGPSCRSSAGGGSSRWAAFTATRRLMTSKGSGRSPKSFRTPTFFDAISGARQLGEIARYNQAGEHPPPFPQTGLFPRGLIPLGDSVCRFNPVFGQGMSVAAQEAVILAGFSTLAAPAPRSTDWPKISCPGSRTNSKRPGRRQCSIWSIRGLGESDRPIWEGGCSTARPSCASAAKDAETHKIMMEVNHLIKPHSALREPQLAARVMALMQAAV